jgi:hypothetical protein
MKRVDRASRAHYIKKRETFPGEMRLIGVVNSTRPRYGR